MPSQQRGHYSSTVGRTDATKAMAPDQLAMALGMGLGMGKMPMGMTGMEAAPASFSSAYLCGLPAGDAMRVDDLLDFSNKDGLLEAATGVSVPETHQHGHGHLPMHDPSPASGSLDCSGYNLMGSFSDDFYMPSEEAAELEWLSKFVDDSFSDVPFSSSSSSSFGGSTDSGEGAAPSSKYTALRAEHSSAIPGRARSKRSRAPTTALHHNPSTSWSSPSPQSPPFRASPTSPSPSPSFSGNAPSGPKSAHGSSNKKKEAAGAVAGRPEGGVRRCTHCASEKTPQWRAGPLGPKTLCNACGVRYKSGRLVAEYRPAASPTFLLTQHSNSHRKVMELRRQKELLLLRQQPQGGGFPPAASSPSSASTTRPAEHVAGVIHAPPVPPPLFPP